MIKTLHTLLLAILLLVAASRAEADVVEFTDFQAWQLAVGDFTTITFAEFPAGTLITDQYADQGVTFSGGFHQVTCCSFPTFPGDGSGLNGLDPILLTFDTPQLWIGVEYPGTINFQLFRRGEMVYDSAGFCCGETGLFAGLIASDAFDSALVYRESGLEVVLDDLHFGVPTAGALLLLALVGMMGPRRRPRET